MSRLITNAIRSTSASADAITMDGSGLAPFQLMQLVLVRLQGLEVKLLQVQQTVKTDTASTTVASGASFKYNFFTCKYHTCLGIK